MARVEGITAEEVIEKHWKLARMIARNISRRASAAGYSFDDLYQEALIALYVQHGYYPDDDLADGLAGKAIAGRLSSIVNPDVNKTWFGALPVGQYGKMYEAMRVAYSLDDKPNEDYSGENTSSSWAEIMAERMNPSTTPEGVALEQDATETLHAMIYDLVWRQTLPNRREVARLVLLEGLGQQEAADKIGVTRQSVSRHLKLLKKELRKDFDLLVEKGMAG